MFERRQSARHRLGVLVQALGPERKPSVPGFEHSQSQIRIPIEHTRADERGHVAHAAPGMRGRALQPEVVPGIQTSGPVGRHDRERVEHDREVVMLRRRPVRLQIGMVQGHAVRRVAEERQRPRLCRASLDLREASAHVAARDQDDAAQPFGIGRAVVRHPAMVGAIQRELLPGVLDGRPGAEPAGGQQQIDVDALGVHIGDARRGVVIDPRVRVAALVRAAVGAHVRAGVRRPCRRLAQTPLVLALADVIRDLAGARVHAAQIAKRLERRALGRGQIAFEYVHRRPDVGVGVEDPVSVSRHGGVLQRPRFRTRP